MSLRRLLPACVVAAALLTPTAAHAQFTNGSFESGSLSSWTLIDIPGPHIAMTVVTAGFNPNFGMFLAAPTDGTFAAMNGYDGTGPGNIILYQEVNVTTANLEFDWRAGWDMLNFGGSTLDRTFSVHIEPSGGGTALQTDLIHTAPFGTSTLDTGAQSSVVDVSAHVGNTVRVVFDWNIPESFTGPAACQLDNVRFTGPSGPTISVGGSCPGSLTMTGTGFTPNGTVYFGYGAVVAPWNILLGPCAGTQISLVNPVLIVVLQADGSGNVSRSGTANAGCGIVNLLCFDAATCQESNFVGI